MAFAAPVTLLRLIHMRLLQHWLHVPRWAWCHSTLCVHITPSHQNFSPWSDLAFLRGGSAHRTSVQACCSYNRCLQNGVGVLCAMGMQPPAPGPDLNYSGTSAGPALVSTVASGQALVCMDNTVTVGYIRHQGGLYSYCILQRHLLL